MNSSTTTANHFQLRSGIIFGLIAATIWGGYLAVAKQGIDIGLDAFDLAFLRYSCSAVVLAPWFLLNSPKHLGGIGWKRGLTLAILAGPPFIFMSNGGYEFAPLAHGAIFQLGTLTLSSIIFVKVVLNQNLVRGQVYGVLIIIAGLGITTGPSLFTYTSSTWRGDLMFMSAGAMWAMFTILQKKWVISPMSATITVSVLAGIIYAPIYAVSIGFSKLQQTSLGFLVEQLVVQGILSGIVALYCFSKAVENLGAGLAALFPAVAPAVAIAIGIPLTGEIPTIIQLLGLVILCSGIIFSAKMTMNINKVKVRTESQNPM